MEQYQILLYHHNEERQFKVGEAVYVWLKSDYSTGRAVVLATPQSLPADSQFAGRYLVRFTACGSTAHVRPERMLPVYQQQHALSAAVQLPNAHSTQQPAQEHHQKDVQLPAEPQPQLQEPQQQQTHQQQVAHNHVPCEAPQQVEQQAVDQQQQQQKQQQQQLVLLVSSTLDYRRLARSQVQASDGVLEVGCSYGVCSKMLQEHAGWLVAVDNSGEVVQEARRRYPSIHFHQVDALEEPHKLVQLAGPSNSSNSSSSTHSTCCCGAGAAAGSSVETPSISSSNRQPAACDCNHHVAGVSPAGSGTAAAPACNCSCGMQQRLPRAPCSVVFSDIGGNRQLESLVKLVPWVLRTLKPRLLVVKSEELTAAAEQQVTTEQQQGEQPCASAAAAAAVEHEAADGAASCRPDTTTCSLQACDSVIHDVSGWWQQLEQQCRNPASLAEPWFVAAKDAGFTRNPMRYPQRSTADGRRICRPYNYDKQRGCLKMDGCPYDHQHCHHCLKADHRAVDCPIL